MSFDFGPYRFNLVDTPGHSDFSEDTYRTLTAVDAAIMRLRKELEPDPAHPRHIQTVRGQGYVFVP